MPRPSLSALFPVRTTPLVMLGTAGAGTAAAFGWPIGAAVATYHSGGGAGELVGIGLLASLVFGSGSMAAAGLLSWQRSVREARAERERAETAARRSEEYHRLFRDAREGILIVDPLTCVVRDANRRGCEFFEIPREHFLGRELASVTHDSRRFATRFRTLLNDGADQEFETVHYRVDGTVIHLLVIASLVEFQGEPAVMVSHREITARKALERKLAHDAFHDSLTGLANRALFRDRVEHSIARSLRNPNQLVVLYVDLDNFKPINDTLGHATGDELLIEVARRVQAALRVTDTLARLGGDEFAILLEDALHPEDSVAVAERIIEDLAAPFQLDGKEVLVGTSIGIAGSWQCDSAEELLHSADVAMYVAKSRGKGRYEVFESEMQATFLERVDLEEELRAGLERGDFEVHYQPIIRLRDGHVTGVEALARWNHPTRGTVAPSAFIPLAERTGMIVRLGEWVLRTACEQMSRWRSELADRAPESFSVNVSGRQLLESDLTRTVVESLRDAGIPASALTLELTETVLTQDTEAILKRLRPIREAGVRIAIDDFGAGYSSLSYLRRLQADVLKIDRAFIEGVGRRDDDSALARAIISLADTLRMTTVAEGVRSQEQASVLVDLGCELGQGHFFSPPLAGDGVTTLLRGGFGSPRPENPAPRAPTSLL